MLHLSTSQWCVSVTVVSSTQPGALQCVIDALALVVVLPQGVEHLLQLLHEYYYQWIPQLRQAVRCLWGSQDWPSFGGNPGSSATPPDNPETLPT